MIQLTHGTSTSIRTGSKGSVAMRLWLVSCLLVAEYATVGVVGWGTHGRARRRPTSGRGRRNPSEVNDMMAERCSQMGYIMPSQSEEPMQPMEPMEAMEPMEPGGTRGARSFSFREHIHMISPNLDKVFLTTQVKGVL